LDAPPGRCATGRDGRQQTHERCPINEAKSEVMPIRNQYKKHSCESEVQTGRNLQCRCVSPGFARKIYGIQCLRQCRCVSRSSFQCPVSQSGVRAHVTCNDCMHQATVKNQAGARSSGLRSISFQFPAPNVIRLTEVWGHPADTPKVEFVCM
jgi:hypothetical protein